MPAFRSPGTKKQTSACLLYILTTNSPKNFLCSSFNCKINTSTHNQLLNFMNRPLSILSLQLPALDSIPPRSVSLCRLLSVHSEYSFVSLDLVYLHMLVICSFRFRRQCLRCITIFLTLLNKLCSYFQMLFPLSLFANSSYSKLISNLK